MTASTRGGRGSMSTRRRDAIASRLDAIPPASSPWPADVLVVPEVPHYGRYGDTVWRFGKQAPNQRETRCDVSWTVGPEAAWPTAAWAQLVV